jgi:hypothetical protein
VSSSSGYRGRDEVALSHSETKSERGDCKHAFSVKTLKKLWSYVGISSSSAYSMSRRSRVRGQSVVISSISGSSRSDRSVDCVAPGVSVELLVEVVSSWLECSALSFSYSQFLGEKCGLFGARAFKFDTLNSMGL